MPEYGFVLHECYNYFQILFSLPSCNQLQVIEQIANVIKESKISLLQDTVCVFEYHLRSVDNIKYSTMPA